MSKYKEIKGFKVQTLASDTAASVASTGSWAAGTSMNTARDYVGGAATSSDSALIFGGSAYNVEQYDGSSWTEKTEMNCPNAVNYARAPMGTATACIAAGGSASYSNLVEQWDGSSWTEIAELNTGRAFGSASPIGTVTAGLVVGGLYANPGQATANSELWNGSAWTETNNLNTARSYDAGLGTSTSALVANGQAVAPGYVVSNTVETWDGSSWTEVAEINTARGRGVAAGINSTAAIYYAGSTGPSTVKAQTESWDGSSWTEVADLATARQRGGGGGTISSAIMAGGNANPPVTGATEEWTTTPAPTFQQINLGQVYYNSGSNAFKVTEQPVPGGSWSSGGSTSNRRANMQGFGTSSNAAIAATGYINPGATNIANVEEYNGTAWTEVNDVNTARRELWEFGTTAAGIIAGGRPPTTAATESWNGSSWTEVNDLNTGRSDSFSSFGTSTSGMLASGYVGPPTTADSETWDGTSWTEVSNVNTARNYAAGFGSLNTSGLIAGGYGTAETAKVESWNGTAWTEITDINSVRYGLSAIGNSVDLGFVVGGYRDSSPPGQKALTELWNGSSWTEIADLSTASTSLGSSGHAGASDGIVFGGNPPSSGYSNASEEFTAPVTNKTITVS